MVYPLLKGVLLGCMVESTTTSSILFWLFKRCVPETDFWTQLCPPTVVVAGTAFVCTFVSTVVATFTFELASESALMDPLGSGMIVMVIFAVLVVLSNVTR